MTEDEREFAEIERQAAEAQIRIPVLEAMLRGYAHMQVERRTAYQGPNTLLRLWPSMFDSGQ